MIKKLKEMIKICEELTGIPFKAELKINSRFTSTYGRATAVYVGEYDERILEPTKIEISKRLESASEKDLYETLAHEYAHYCAYIRVGEHTHSDRCFRYFCEILNTSSNGGTYIKLAKEEKKPKYTVSCSCCGRGKDFYSSSSKIIKANGVGYVSGCCRASVNVVKNY